MLVGEQAGITLSSNFSGSAQFDIVCENKVESLVSDETLLIETSCKFDTPGMKKIVVKANGAECASANIEVREKARGSCHIDMASVERDLSAHSYRWTLYFSGFEAGDEMTWACDNTVAKKKIAADMVFGMPLYDILSCDFPGAPRGDAINVSIEGVPCGQVPTR